MLKEQDKSSDIEQQPPFGDRKGREGLQNKREYHRVIFTSVEYFLYKLYWKRRVCHDSMKSIAMQISTAPPIMTYIVLLSAYEVVDING